MVDPSRLNLFVPTSNNLNNVGEQRGTYAPNPRATNFEDRDNFYKFGAMLAVCVYTADIVNITFPVIFWKELLSKPKIYKSQKSLFQQFFTFFTFMHTFLPFRVLIYA